MLLLAVLAVLVPCALYVMSQRRKAVAVALVANRTLVTRNARFPMGVTYRGTALSQPRLLVLAIANVGNVPVEADDYESPLRVELRRTRVLDAAVSRTYPQDLRAELVHSDDALELRPLLMNPGDSVEVQCLLDGPLGSQDIVPGGRISGVAFVPLLSVPRTSWDQPYRVPRLETVISIAAAGLLSALLAWPAWEWPPTTVTYVVVGAASALLVLFIRTTLRRDRHSRLFLSP